MNFESLDILIVVGLVLGLIRGLATGAVRQTVGFIGSIVAIVLGLELMHPVGNALGPVLGLGDGIRPVVGFVIVFLIIQIALLFAVRMVEAAIAALSLSPVNRLLGGAVGACKAALLLSVLFLVLGFFNVPEQENREDSVLYQPVANVFPVTWNYVAAHLPYMRNLSDRFGKEVEGVLSEHVRDSR